ncbi:MAG: RDD family protein, partial [SAR86 cluster bacterium]|nr:RDD family protein [SAR86 cluster bacterium]
MPGATPIYVGFWSRFLAFLIDSLVASLFLYPLSLLYDPALALNLD